MTMKIAILFPACLTIFMTACRQQQPVSQLKEINEALEKANSIKSIANRCNRVFKNRLA
ncbi:outer membrane lipoprotein-sorting protein [Chitinophagaceae bacterium OAS944]